MDSLLDYMEWYGDFSFSQKPLTEVDNFILVRLCYLLMRDIKLDKPRHFKDIVKELLATTGIQGSFSGNEIIVTKAAATKRFGKIVVTGYEDVYDAALSAQFSATTFDLTRTERFIAFRGTDDTMAGWKEDFMISFMETEAQKCALDYLRKYIDDSHRIYVAGHSKGANLALYSAVHIEEEKQAKIAHLFMDDGPGLCPEVCDKSLVDKIKDRATRYSPEYSIFGKLFEETDIPEKIIKSSAEGVLQHDPFTWGVDHGKPCITECNSSGSVFINQVLDQWIECVSNDRRTSFVNDLFSSIENCGITTTTQVVERGPEAIEKILIEMLALDKDTVRTLMKLPLTAALDRAPDTAKARKIKRKVKKQEWLPYVLMILTSAALFTVPDYVMEVGISAILLVAILFEFVVTVRHLHRAKWNLQEESARVYICLAMIGFFVMLWIKEDALFFIGSVTIGVAFLAWAYRNAIVYKSLTETTEKKERRGEKIKLIIEIVLLIALGTFILLAPRDTIKWYMYFLGGVFVVDGIVNLSMVIERALWGPKE